MSNRISAEVTSSGDEKREERQLSSTLPSTIMKAAMDPSMTTFVYIIVRHFSSMSVGGWYRFRQIPIDPSISVVLAQAAAFQELQDEVQATEMNDQI